MQRSALAWLLSLALTAAATSQEGSTTHGPGGPGPLTAAAFSTFGTGCPGSGQTYGRDIVVPAFLAGAFGNSFNNIPFSWKPVRYQQVFLGSEIAFNGTLLGIGLRQDDQFQGFDAAVVDLEVALGGTTFDHDTISSTFASNFNGTVPAKTVFKRRKFALPRMPATFPANPAEFFLTIPFDLPYSFALPAGENLIVDVVNWGNSLANSIFIYSLDAASGVTTARVYSSGDPGAPIGVVQNGYGHVMALRPLGNDPALPTIYSTNLPQLGTNFTFGLANARANTTAILLVGFSDTRYGALRLPFDMAAVGAPGCSLLASAEGVLSSATAAGGDLPVTMGIPFDLSLDGGKFYLQYLILDPGVNALQLVASNAGAGTIGT